MDYPGTVVTKLGFTVFVNCLEFAFVMLVMAGNNEGKYLR